MLSGLTGNGQLNKTYTMDELLSFLFEIVRQTIVPRAQESDVLRCHHIGTATIKKGGLVTLKKAFENISSHRKSVSINNIIINSYQWLF